MLTPVNPETREVMIALQGLWEFDDPVDGPFIVDWQDLSIFQDYINNFKNNARGQRIPFFAVHADKTEAAGWLEDMYMAPAVDDNEHPILDEEGKQRTALMGLAEWNSLGQHKIADKQFLYLSPSFQGEWQNPLTKTIYRNVIFEISMTNSPMQKYLKQLKLSERSRSKECDKRKLVNFSEKGGKSMADDAAKKAQEDRSSKYGIRIREGGAVTKPSEYSNLPDSEFADPVNYAYPIDKEHVLAAYKYFSKSENQGFYSAEEKAAIKKRIIAALPENYKENAKENMSENKGKETTMADFEIDPEKKKVIDGAQASKEDMKNDKAGDGFSEKKDCGKELSVDEKLNKFEEALSELSGDFKGKEGNPHAKALGKILSSHFKSLKEKHFPDEDPGDGPAEGEKPPCSEKAPCDGKMSEKEKVISMSEKRMLSELAELKTFKREATVERMMGELEKQSLVKPGEAEFLKSKLMSLSEINDTVTHLSEGSGKRIDLAGDVAQLIQKCCYANPMHSQEKGTGALQPEEKKISLSEKKIQMTKEYAEKNGLKTKSGLLDISKAAAELSAMRAYDGLTE